MGLEETFPQTSDVSLVSNKHLIVLVLSVLFFGIVTFIGYYLQASKLQKGKISQKYLTISIFGLSFALSSTFIIFLIIFFLLLIITLSFCAYLGIIFLLVLIFLGCRFLLKYVKKDPTGFIFGSLLLVPCFTYLTIIVDLMIFFRLDYIYSSNLIFIIFSACSLLFFILNLVIIFKNYIKQKKNKVMLLKMIIRELFCITSLLILLVFLKDALLNLSFVVYDLSLVNMLPLHFLTILIPSFLKNYSSFAMKPKNKKFYSFLLILYIVSTTILTTQFALVFYFVIYLK